MKAKQNLFKRAAAELRANGRSNKLDRLMSRMSPKTESKFKLGFLDEEEVADVASVPDAVGVAEG